MTIASLRRKPARALVLTGVGAVILTACGKLMAFGRDVALSFYFGVSSETDAFFIANVIPGIAWAAFLVAINVVFLPLYIEHRTRIDGDSSRFATEAIQIYVLLALIMAVACAVGAGAIVRWTAPGAAISTIELARTLTIIMAGGFAFSGYVAVQNAIQQAHGLYQAPLAVPVINNLLAIVGIVIAAHYEDVRIAVAVAVLAWVLQAPIQRFQTRKFYRTVPRFIIRSATLNRLALLSAPVMLGTFLDQINIYVGVYLAGGLGEGAISQLNYASRLAMFLATTFSILVSYFLFPRLAADASMSDDARTARTLGRGVLLVVAITLPPTILAIVLRDDVIGLIYGRGVFATSSMAGTVSAFAFFALGVVFIAVREILNRLFFSFQRNVVPLVIGIVASAANYVISQWLSGTMGTAGIALGASIAAMIFLLGQLLAIIAWKPRLLNRELLVGLVAIAAAAMVAWFVLTAILPALAGFGSLLRILAAGAIVAATFFLTLLPFAWWLLISRDPRAARPKN